MLRTLFILAAPFVVCTSTYGQGCKAPKLQDVAANHPECLFFSGTAEFRDKNYAGALVHWSKLLDLPPLAIEDEHLRVDAMNNAGYLHYMGLGTEPDRPRALKLWNEAFSRGHEEAAYHLCHFYADSREPEYNVRLARGFCSEALRRYSLLKNSDEGSEQVVGLVQKYLASLPAQ
jgi:TPR repeat protein